MTRIMSQKQKISTQYSNDVWNQVQTPDINDANTRAMILFSVIAFVMSWFSNDKCKPIKRFFKALIASLFGILYIIIFGIKYSLTNCN